MKLDRKPRSPVGYRLCKRCGKQFLALMPWHKFCNNDCTSKWHNEAKQVPPCEQNCLGCGNIFINKDVGRSRRTFCSISCREAFYDTKAGRLRRAQKRVDSINTDRRKFWVSTVGNRGRAGYRHLTVDQVEELWLKQEGKCAVSGRFMTTIAGQGYVLTNASLDRVVPSGDYRLSNVRLVCRIVNQMKFQLSDEEWLGWTIDIVHGLAFRIEPSLVQKT